MQLITQVLGWSRAPGLLLWGEGPVRGCPLHWAMLSTSHVETGLGKSWAPSRQQTSFPRRCQSASEDGAWEPGHGMYASCMAAEGGWATATALGAPGHQTGRGTLSRPEAASLPWSCYVLCALLGSRTLARPQEPHQGLLWEVEWGEPAPWGLPVRSCEAQAKAGGLGGMGGGGKALASLWDWDSCELDQDWWAS